MRASIPQAIVIHALTLSMILVATAILLCNDFYAPADILAVAAIPAVIAPLLLRPGRDAFKSVILLAALTYGLSLVLATLLYGGFPLAGVLPFLPPLVATVGTIAVLCMLIRSSEGFIRVFCDWVTLACAVSAAVNTLAYFRQDMSWGVIANFRLVPYIGIPVYQSSTTIGATYAIYFTYAFSVLTASRRPHWQKAVFGLAAASLLLALIATQARGAYLAALAGVFAVSFSTSRRNRLIAIAFLIAAGLAALYPPYTAALLFRGDGYRIGIWLSYLQMAADRPLAGYGLLTDTTRLVEGSVFIHAHSVVLAAEIRGGLLGLASMAALLGAGLYWSAAYANRRGDPGLLGMIVALVADGILNHEVLITYPSWPWVTFWLPLGLAAGAEVKLRSAARQTAAARQPAIHSTVDPQTAPHAKIGDLGIPDAAHSQAGLKRQGF